MDTIEYSLPAYWASYLVNGDDSGLEEGEQEEIDAFIKDNNLGACIDVSEEPCFSWTNDANNLGGDVATFVFETKETGE